MLNFVDTHCHLDAAEFAADRDAVASAACAAGIGEIWVPAVSAANFPEVQVCCQRYSGCRPAYGIHPLYTPQARPEDLDTLRAWVRKESPFAIGEIGLDGYVPGLDHAQQTYYFAEQLKIARDAGLPVLLHVRRAVDEVLKYLRRTPVPGGIAHAFNGSRQQADMFIALGFKLGFGGSLTFAGSTRIRALATDLPLSAIVLETDAPDIPPAWLNQGRNSPDQLPRIADELAALRGLSVEEVALQTSLNAALVRAAGGPI